MMTKMSHILNGKHFFACYCTDDFAIHRDAAYASSIFMTCHLHIWQGCFFQNHHLGTHLRFERLSKIIQKSPYRDRGFSDQF